MRIGHGMDAHRFAEGRPLVLCGVTIPYDKGLMGHSDADVATHALMDALLGAVALGDIGLLFPDTEEQFAGACSIDLLGEVVTLIASAGYRPVNVDITIVAQRPRLMPYIDPMRQALAIRLKLPLPSVSVKATTTEGLGYEGREEGITAYAVCLLREEG